MSCPCDICGAPGDPASGNHPSAALCFEATRARIQELESTILFEEARLKLADRSGYGSLEHAAELSKRLASERLKTETLERTRDEWKKRAEGWEASATVRGAAAEALAEKLHVSQEEVASERAAKEEAIAQRDAAYAKAEESEAHEAQMLAEVGDALIDAREELERQIKITVMMSEGRERFLRALQGISSEPCASRLVSGKECDPKEFPCARCKAKQAISESERAKI